MSDDYVSTTAAPGLLARIRANPVVSAVIVAFAVMGAFGILKAFLTDTAPWMVDVFGPYAPVVVEWLPIALVGLAAGLSAYAFLAMRRVREALRHVAQQEQHLLSVALSGAGMGPPETHARTEAEFLALVAAEAKDQQAAILDTMTSLNTALERFEYDNQRGLESAGDEAKQAVLAAVSRVEAIDDTTSHMRVRTFRDVFNVTPSGWRADGGASASQVAALRAAHADAIRALGDALRRSRS